MRSLLPAILPICLLTAESATITIGTEELSSGEPLCCS